MQNYTEIAATTKIDQSLPAILNNDKTIMSNHAGTSFPTTNLQVGMFCYRSDEDANYQLKSTGPDVWELLTTAGGGSLGPGDSYRTINFEVVEGQTVFKYPFGTGPVWMTINNVLLEPTDFTAADGYTLTLTEAVTATDTVRLHFFTLEDGNSFTVAPFTATDGQITFTTPYTVGSVWLSMNGIILVDGVDYTASNGTSIDLTVAAALNDEITVYSTNSTNFSITTINATEGQTDFVAPYDVASFWVVMNGIILEPEDIVGLNDGIITLTPAALNDTVSVYSMTQTGTGMYYTTLEAETRFEPKDPTILKASAIGVSVHPYDADALSASDIGVSVQPYNVSTLTSDAIGVSVQPKGEYEPKIAVKGTSYNKDFGTTPDTVAEGNHTHAGTPLIYGGGGSVTLSRGANNSSDKLVIAPSSNSHSRDTFRAETLFADELHFSNRYPDSKLAYRTIIDGLDIYRSFRNVGTDNIEDKPLVKTSSVALPTGVTSAEGLKSRRHINPAGTRYVCWNSTFSEFRVYDIVTNALVQALENPAGASILWGSDLQVFYADNYLVIADNYRVDTNGNRGMFHVYEVASFGGTPSTPLPAARDIQLPTGYTTTSRQWQYEWQFDIYSGILAAGSSGAKSGSNNATGVVFRADLATGTVLEHVEGNENYTNMGAGVYFNSTTVLALGANMSNSGDPTHVAAIGFKYLPPNSFSSYIGSVISLDEPLAQCHVPGAYSVEAVAMRIRVYNTVAFYISSPGDGGSIHDKPDENRPTLNVLDLPNSGLGPTSFYTNVNIESTVEAGGSFTIDDVFVNSDRLVLRDLTYSGVGYGRLLIYERGISSIKFVGTQYLSLNKATDRAFVIGGSNYFTKVLTTYSQASIIEVHELDIGELDLSSSAIPSATAPDVGYFFMERVNGGSHKYGFIGHDASTGRFTHLTDGSLPLSTKIFVGSLADAEFRAVYVNNIVDTTDSTTKSANTAFVQNVMTAYVTSLKDEQFTGSATDTFVYANTANASTVKIYKNGVKLNSTEITSISSTQAVLASAVLAGDYVSIEYSTWGA